jgi:cytoskeletal protein CcmA (bactofilin family)
VHRTSLFISPKAAINGDVEADRVVVNGKVEGHIRSSEVVLKSHAHVVGDVQCQRLFIERGAYFDGRSKCSPQTDMRTAPATLTASVNKANELKATREPVDASAA